MDVDVNEPSNWYAAIVYRREGTRSIDDLARPNYLRVARLRVWRPHASRMAHGRMLLYRDCVWPQNVSALGIAE